MSGNRDTIFFLGPGTIGTSLCLLLEQAGFEIAGMWGRSAGSLKGMSSSLKCPRFHGSIPPEIADATDVFITTSDSAINDIAVSLSRSGYVTDGVVIFHCSGALDSSVLGPLRELGASVGTFHPLQSVPTVESGIQALPGSFFTLEGDALAVSTGRRLVEAIGGAALELQGTSRGIYHASASMASNYLVTLVWSAVRMMASAGAPVEEALRALRPMMTNVLDNMSGLGLQGALTGPIARGDLETVRIQLDAVAEKSPGDLPLFLALARSTLELAEEKGGLGEDCIAGLKDVIESFDGSIRKEGQDDQAGCKCRSHSDNT